MYKITLFIVLIIASSIGFAQNFSFNPPATSASPSQPSSNMMPQRQPTPSAQGFANSSERAFQAQQAKIAALAAEQRRIEAVNNAKLPSANTTQKGMQPPIQQQAPVMQRVVAPAATPPQPSTVVSQPYTGFQSPNNNPTGSTAAPTNNNSNSSGWGSSIKY